MAANPSPPCWADGGCWCPSSALQRNTPRQGRHRAEICVTIQDDHIVANARLYLNVHFASCQHGNTHNERLLFLLNIQSCPNNLDPLPLELRGYLDGRMNIEDRNPFSPSPTRESLVVVNYDGAGVEEERSPSLSSSNKQTSSHSASYPTPHPPFPLPNLSPLPFRPYPQQNEGNQDTMERRTRGVCMSVKQKPLFLSSPVMTCL